LLHKSKSLLADEDLADIKILSRHYSLEFSELQRQLEEQIRLKIKIMQAIYKFKFAKIDS